MHLIEILYCHTGSNKLIPIPASTHTSTKFQQNKEIIGMRVVEVFTCYMATNKLNPIAMYTHLSEIVDTHWVEIFVTCRHLVTN